MAIELETLKKLLNNAKIASSNVYILNTEFWIK